MTDANQETSHWLHLRDAALRMAEWEESHGRIGTVYRTKAATYERAAEAEILSTERKQPHCVCCLKPLGLHRT